MKTTKMNRWMLVAAWALASVCSTNAAEPTKVTNMEMENDRLSAKVVYLQDGGLLRPEFRFEFRYDEAGRIAEKKGLKWNGTEWANYYCMTVTYVTTEAHVNYAMWNKEKRSFVPVQDYVYTSSAEAGAYLLSD